MKLAVDVFMEDVEARRLWTCCTSSHVVVRWGTECMEMRRHWDTRDQAHPDAGCCFLTAVRSTYHR